MKIIDVPKPIEKVPLRLLQGNAIAVTELTMNFGEWLLHALDAYKEHGKGAKAARAGARILSAVEVADGVLRLEDGDHDIMKAALEAMDWNPAVNNRAARFWEAFEKAQDVDTAEKK